MHGQPVPSKCAVVEVTTIRKGREFENLDYLDEVEGIEKLKDAKRNFILWSCKDIIIKICSPPIVLLLSRENEGTPTSQNTICSTAAFTPCENPPKTTPPPGIQHLHNLLSIILLSVVLLRMVFLQSLLFTLPLLFKINQRNKLFSNVLLHMFILWNLHTLLLFFKIYQLNKLLSSVLLHMFILRSLLLTVPILFKIYQLNKLLSSVLLHIFIFWSLLHTLHLLFKIHQMNNLLSSVLLYMFIIQSSSSHYLSFSNSTKNSEEEGCHFPKPAKILRPYLTNFMMVWRIIKPRNHWRT
jgi:hypothetical protein